MVVLILKKDLTRNEVNVRNIQAVACFGNLPYSRFEVDAN